MTRFRVTIGSVAEGLTDYPVYIDLGDMPASFWSTVSSGGGDIRVYESDGTTELPREVVSCNKATSTGELHVKTNLSSIVDTDLIIDVDGLRGEYATNSTYGAENVWTNGYAAVWHLNSVTGLVMDSTGNGNNGTNEGMWTDTGKIGTGVASDGSTNYNRISINPTQLSMAFTHADDMTTTAWIKPNSWSGRSEIIGSRRADSFGIGVNSNGTIEGQFDDVFPASTGTLTFGSWNYVSVVHNGDASSPTADFYINGVYDSSGSSWDGNGWATQGYIYIGHESRGNSRLNGVVDEIRVSRASRSAGWLATEYANQNNPTAFYTIEEVVPNLFKRYTGSGWAEVTPEIM